ncbi:hypothetical protein Tsubulata_027052, partial [Turnera subulata]
YTQILILLLKQKFGRRVKTKEAKWITASYAQTTCGSNPITGNIAGDGGLLLFFQETSFTWSAHLLLLSTSFGRAWIPDI